MSKHSIQSRLGDEESSPLIKRNDAKPRTWTTATVLAAIFGIVATVVGMTARIVTLNFWLHNFHENNLSGGAYTVLTLVRPIVGGTYLIILGVWCIVKRRSLGFVLHGKGVLLLIAAGLAVAVNGVLMVFATRDTPELYQAMLLSLQMVFTFLFSAAFRLNKGRSYCHPLVFVSFALVFAGVLTGMAESFKGTNHLSKDQAKWTVLFGVSMVPAALFNVLSSVFMKRYTANKLIPEEASLPDKADYGTVNLTLLAGSGIAQAVFLWISFPMDWAPGFGTAANGSESWHNLLKGYHCTFFDCKSNFGYFLSFYGSFFLSMGGVAVMNSISAPLTAMVSQLASPLAGVVLLIIPSWNVTGDKYKVGEIIGALILIVAGSMAYVAWEQWPKAVTPAEDVAEVHSVDVAPAGGPAVAPSERRIGSQARIGSLRVISGRSGSGSGGGMDTLRGSFAAAAAAVGNASMLRQSLPYSSRSVQADSEPTLSVHHF